eukprot:350716_1
MTVLSNWKPRSISSFIHRTTSNSLNKHINFYQYNRYTNLAFTSSIHSHRPFSKYQCFTYQTNNFCSTAGSSVNVNDVLSQINELEERQQCRNVVDTILLDPRVKLPYEEYISICSANNLNEASAQKLTEALHTTGIIWYFNSYFEDKKPLIIKTNEVCKAFLRSLDLDGIIRDEFMKDKKEQLKHYLLEIKPLEEQHEEIELKARKYVRNCWRGFFGYVVVHCMAVPYLTFWKYSWDIMEPVTYMFNLWGLFMGTWFYLNANCDFSNEGISSSILRMKKEKLYKKYNFDIQRYTFLQEKIAEIEDDLFNPEWEMLKSVHPQLPDYIKHIHLTPNELLKTYEKEQMQHNYKI